MKSAHDDIIIAIDQGTSSTKAIAVSLDGVVTAEATCELTQSFPSPGWVEQDALEVADSVKQVVRALVNKTGAHVAGVGLSTQRESAVAWNRKDGSPLSKIISWQDRRTVDRAQQRFASGEASEVRKESGLPLDPMFSALKFEWILDTIDADRARARNGEIALGTVDSWLVRSLTGETQIELGNASRTQLLNPYNGRWSQALLETFSVPLQALPELVESDSVVKTTINPEIMGMAGVPIVAVLGDSHAALFGHGIRESGAVKATYGTGSSVMGLTSTSTGTSAGVVDTIAWSLGGKIAHAFEGNILSSGATLVWLSGLFGERAEDLAELAASTQPSPVDFVPGFAGLGAPWWDERAVAVISGVTLGTSRADIARAALEAVALQVESVLREAESAGYIDRVALVKADGGPASNDWLMQLQADLSQRKVERPNNAALSALGVAWLAGSTLGIWELGKSPWPVVHNKEFVPTLEPAFAKERYKRWIQAVSRSRGQEITTGALS